MGAGESPGVLGVGGQFTDEREEAERGVGYSICGCECGCCFDVDFAPDLATDVGGKFAGRKGVR